MKYVVLTDMYDRQPDQKVFDRENDADKLFLRIVRAHFNEKPVRTRTNERFFVERCRLYAADTDDVREAVSIVDRGEATKLQDSEVVPDDLELDL